MLSSALVAARSVVPQLRSSAIRHVPKRVTSTSPKSTPSNSGTENRSGLALILVTPTQFRPIDILIIAGVSALMGWKSRESVSADSPPSLPPSRQLHADAHADNRERVMQVGFAPMTPTQKQLDERYLQRLRAWNAAYPDLQIKSEIT